MKTKRLGNSDLFITPMGFGAWAIGGSGWEFGWGDQDDKASIAAIHRALELGVNWIDTAAVYGMGHSEEVVASALKTWSGPRPYVFTKCGLRWDEQGYVHNNLKPKSIGRPKAWKKAGARWLGCGRKERSAGSEFLTSMPTNCGGRRKSLR